MKKILFVCSGNTCRSPMAAAIFNDMCNKENLDFTAQSAGVATVNGLPASTNSIKALEEIGLDLTSHKSTFLPDVDIFEFDYICVMNYNQATIIESMGVERGKIYILQSDKKQSKYDFETGISDPYGGDINVYRACRDELLSAVGKLVSNLKNCDKSKENGGEADADK